MNLYDQILEAINTDDEDTNLISTDLIILYEEATTEEKKIIDQVFRILTGWSFQTLFNKT